MGFDLGHLMKVRLTSLGNEDDDLNLLMRKRKGRILHTKKLFFKEDFLFSNCRNDKDTSFNF